VTVVEGAPAERFDAFAASDVALAASGTVSLELGLAGVPMVVGYRVHPVSAAIARRLVKVDSVVLINLIVNRQAIPEFLQEGCRPGPLAEAVARLLDNEQARTRQVAASSAALGALGHGAWLPSERAAAIVLEAMHPRER
jgi:lipid-A-disaccharide synthase